MKAYSKLHYGREMTDIKPRAVVVHWTANDSQEGTYQFFYAEENPRLSYGTLNVGAQFLVGRDGAHLAAHAGNGPCPPCHWAQLVRHRH